MTTNTSKKETKSFVNPLEIPFWKHIRDQDNILIAGCGGGFDVYQGLPLLFTLRKMGKTCHLANYTFVSSFNKVPRIEDKNTGACVYKVTADVDSQNYFPEYYLSKWFRDNENTDEIIWTFPREEIEFTKNAYQLLVDTLKIECIILIDGGTDSLMTGSEMGVGTLEEDFTSMFAAQHVKLVSNNDNNNNNSNDEQKENNDNNDNNKNNSCNKFLVCLGLGVDRFHSVSDVSTLKSISRLTTSGDFYGGFTLLNIMEPVDKYIDAVRYASKLNISMSIVGCSICDSINGGWRNETNTYNPRTIGSQLFINPLMSIYWFFNLGGCIKRIHPFIRKAFEKDYKIPEEYKLKDDELKSFEYDFNIYDALKLITSKQQRENESEEFPKTNDTYFLGTKL